MREYFPLLAVGAIVGILSAAFITAFVLIKDKKEAIGFDRNMKDSELFRRLIHYAKPHAKSFIAVIITMILSISYDVISPMLVGNVEKMIKESFELPDLFSLVALYASILVMSLICTYIQAIILQKTGQKIISEIREDLFGHIESLSHAQLNSMPVGKLVTRVTNDTFGLAVMFTNTIVNMLKNCFVLIGVTVAMFMLNYALTLMVLCFAPFIALFSVIFRKFSRKVHRRVKDDTTLLNTFLSENLSGMKIIQIFNREERKQGEFEERNRKLGRAKSAQIFVFGIFRPTMYLMYYASILCLFYIGARGYIKDETFLGVTIAGEMIVSFYMYISKFFNPIQNLAEQFNLRGKDIHGDGYRAGGR